MKKITLAVITVLVFGFANAQSAKFGLKGGLNFANQSFSGNGAPAPSTIVGFNVGAFVEFKIIGKFAIQPELLYSTQGSEFKTNQFVEGSNYNLNVKFDLAYLNVPVMLKYYVAPKFNLEFGPQIGFMTSSKMIVTVIGQGSGSQDAKSLFESVDFGLNIGAGFDFTNKLAANARYNLGLSNTLKNTSGSDSAKNSVISLSLAYKL
jgi:Outer membrane protein beta-barrel domain